LADKVNGQSALCALVVVMVSEALGLLVSLSAGLPLFPVVAQTAAEPMTTTSAAIAVSFKDGFFMTLFFTFLY
jgi:hypothetical protein